jgi:DNA-binding winged helix-turn-helix (wHTH) protein/tetratricopeptide (TPR) repeat protein
MQNKGILRFGDFELDPVARSLRKHGERIPLTRRSFDILLLFARHPGEIVSREELIKCVWPDTFVDENTLSQSISTLRKSLAERPGDNNFIATLPGRGYQFVAQVLEIPASPPERQPIPDIPSHALLLEDRTVRTHIVTEHDEQNVATGRPLLRGRGLALVLTIVAAAAAAAGWLVHDLRRPQPYPHIDTVIADLDNTTGDADFDHTLNKVLQIDLQQSPYFSVVSDGRARKTLALMGQSSEARLTDQLAREVCQRLNGQIYFTPGIASLGGHYLLSLLANDCVDGHALSAQRRELTSKGEVLREFTAMISSARRDVGESRASLKKFDKPFFEEKTSSLEALKAYSEAERLGDAGKYTQSIPLFRHAIELDPQFAVAYADMGSMCYNLGDTACSKISTTKAYSLRATVNERERFYIELRYAQSVTGDLHALLDSLHAWSAMYPEDNLPLGDLVNFETWTGQFTQAASDADRLQALEQRRDLHNGITLEIEARAYFHAHMPDKLRTTYDDAVHRKLDDAAIHGLMLQQAAADGNWAGIDRQIALVSGTPDEAHVLQEAGSAYLAAGQVRQAEALFQQATAAARRENLLPTLTDLDDYHVRMLVELGLNDQARSLLQTLPATDPSLDKAFAEAELGLERSALEEASKQLAEAPTDTLMTLEFVPSVQAAVALRNNKPEDAIRLLQAAEPYEMHDPAMPYLRGQAYLAAHRGKEAAAEFSRIAEQPWVGDPAAPVVELAELGLARSLAQQGLKEQAIASYRRFLNSWAQAEPSLPVLIQARAELARLAPPPAKKR